MEARKRVSALAIQEANRLDEQHRILLCQNFVLVTVSRHRQIFLQTSGYLVRMLVSVRVVDR